MDLIFENISYTVKSLKKNGKHKSSNKVEDAEMAIKKRANAGSTAVLKSISGHIGKGQLLAMMGPSGSGKTSLMDILAGRTKNGNLSGSIAIRDVETGIVHTVSANDSYYKSISAYVMQDDVFYPNLTVRETLIYAFDLKVNKRHSKEDKLKRVDQIIKDLNLGKVADNRVGSPLKRGLSGGERRRLSIAVELVTSPLLLFLDEPTSGLDSRNAYKVIKCLKRLCESTETTIVCTIHQPSSTIFHLFDLMLLIYEGQMVYFGQSLDSISYFGRLGFECPQYMNPAEFILDIVLDDPDSNQIDPNADDDETDIEESKNKVPVVKDGEEKCNVFEAFPLSAEFKTMMDKIQSEMKKSSNAHNSKEISASVSKSLNNKTLILISRIWRNTVRDQSIMVVRTLSAWAIAALVGVIFFQLPYNQTSSEKRVSALLFLMCVFSLFCIPAISKIIEDRLLFQRERAAGAYSTLPYFIAVWVVEIPILVAMVVGYGAICYWMVGLQNNVYSFLFFLATIVLVVNTGFSLSQALASLTQSTNAAIALYMIILVYSILFGGFIVSTKELPSAINWMPWTSYFHFGFEALVINEFDQKGDWGLPTLKSMAMEDKNKFVDLGALAIFFAVTRLLAYLGLRFVQKERR